MFLNEYKLGKTGPYLEDGRKVWSAKSIAFKAKYKQAAFDANASK